MNRKERIFHILKTIRCMLGWHDYRVITHSHSATGILGWTYDCRICGHKKYICKDIE